MKPMIHAAEAAISQGMIDGSLRHERLQMALRDIDNGRYIVPLTDLRQALAHSNEHSVAEGLVAWLTDIQHHHHVPVALLQVFAIGFYRIVWQLMARLDPDIALVHIRQLSATQAAQVCYGFTFGVQPQPFPLPPEFCERLRARIQIFMCREGQDQCWRDDGAPQAASGPFPLWNQPCQSPNERAIRLAFLRKVLVDILPTETCVADHESVIVDLLFQADAHPENFSFLQTISGSQARFRIRQLALALVRLHGCAAALRTLCSGRLEDQAFITCFLTPVVSMRSWLRKSRDQVISHLAQETELGDIRSMATEEDLTGGALAPADGSDFSDRRMRSDRRDLASSA